MKCRKLDSNFDYVFGNNQFDYVDKLDAITIAIRTKLLLFYQEWWEDLSIGIPMFQSIIGKINSEKFKMTVTLLVSERILEVPGVISVENVLLTTNERNIVLSVDVNTEYGNTTVEVNQ